MLDSWCDNYNMEQKDLRFRRVSYQDKFKAGFSTQLYNKKKMRMLW